MRIHTEAFYLGVVMMQDFSVTTGKKSKACCNCCCPVADIWNAIPTCLDTAVSPHTSVLITEGFMCNHTMMWCYDNLVLLKEEKKMNARGSWVILNAHHMAFKLNLLKWLVSITSFLPKSYEMTLHGQRLICSIWIRSATNLNRTFWNCCISDLWDISSLVDSAGPLQYSLQSDNSSLRANLFFCVVSSVQNRQQLLPPQHR